MAERNPWEAGEIERWPVKKLRNYQQNTRTHSDEQISQIKDSIIEFGFTVPPLIDETGEIICGHARIRAAVELGIVVLPVIVARGWSDERKRGYRIADNQLPLNSGWNTELLKVELGDLAKLDFPLRVIGFPDVELRQFVAGFGDGQTPAQSGTNGTLAEQFGVPPFSVLNARTGWWQLRKAAWIGLGMQPELGRADTRNYNTGAGTGGAGFSNQTVGKRHGRRAANGKLRESV